MIPTPYKHLTTQAPLALGAASVASAAFGAQTYAIRIVSSGNCHFAIGASPSASASSAYLAGNTKAEFIGVSPGQKIAVIQDGSATGNFYVTELTR